MLKSLASEDLAALSRSQAMISFKPDGTVITANENFCAALGYELAEIVGRHHSMFVDPEYRKTAQYELFWRDLRAGKFDRAQYKRIGKDGNDIWIEASYNPVIRRGKVVRVIKIATDVTEQKTKSMEDASKLDAISRSQAIIEFEPDGKVISANDNFCTALGYSAEEIIGEHHSMFCQAVYVQSPEYAKFWSRLANGESISDEFVRYAKNGIQVWIQAVYNPVLNDRGQVYKVIKVATDVTERMRCLDMLSSAISEVANCNLSVVLQGVFTPSMERTKSDFNQAVRVLNTFMTHVLEGAQGISASARQTGDASDDLAKRTEQQAGAVEETAAALAQLTESVTSTSTRATEAGQSVTATRKAAEESGRVVNEAITAMSEIERSSKEISSILGVIDEIAFQTNLLALNAGVEAARAGDAGKGFAVVAQEVRELAQRAAAAAKDIKSLIEVSSRHVVEGVSLVQNTGVSLTSIIGRVANIDGNISAIVEATHEQTNSIREINNAVNAIDRSTQQNASIAEEATAANRSMNSELNTLMQQLARFTLDQAAHPSSSPATGAAERRTAA